VARRKEGADGVKSFFWIFHQAIHLALWLLLMFFFAIAADLAAAFYLWHDDPVGGMENLLAFYVDQASDPTIASRIAQWTYDTAYGWGLDKMAAHASGPLSGRASAFSGSMQRSLFDGDLLPYTTVALYGAKLFGLRAAMLVTIIPQFVLVIVLAMVDGAVARYIRRVCGGAESATRFHHAKRFVSIGIVPLVAIIWLIAPYPIPLHWLFFPVIVVIAMATWMMAKYYKKYL
jgi:hypothetical protein